jgi:hypothetical protein
MQFSHTQKHNEIAVSGSELKLRSAKNLGKKFASGFEF